MRFTRKITLETVRMSIETIELDKIKNINTRIYNLNKPKTNQLHPIQVNVCKRNKMTIWTMIRRSFLSRAKTLDINIVSVEFMQRYCYLFTRSSRNVAARNSKFKPSYSSSELLSSDS